MSQVSKKLLEILACPKCKAKIEPEGNQLKCTNSTCGLIYPLENGIPVMLVERASKTLK